jgi:pyrroloquinoline-quinone synthase
LTELFAPDLMSERLVAFERYYNWVPSWGLEYFRSRLTQARVDSDQGLELTIIYCSTRELQEEAVRALSFKCDLLWAMLDPMMVAYGSNLDP